MTLYDAAGLVSIEAPDAAKLGAHFPEAAGAPDVFLEAVDALELTPGIVKDPYGRAAEIDVQSWASPQTLVRYEHGFDPDHLFRRVVLPALRVRFLAQRTAIVRGSAFAFDGQRYAVCGWTGSGKTRLLMEALRSGASYLGDDWIAIDHRGVVRPIDLELHVPEAAIAGLHDALPVRARGAHVARRALAASTRLAARGSTRSARIRQGLAWLGELPSQVSWLRAPFFQIFANDLGTTGPLDVIAVFGRTDALARRIASCGRYEWARDREALAHTLPRAALEILDDADRTELGVIEAAVASTPVVPVNEHTTFAMLTARRPVLASADRSGALIPSAQRSGAGTFIPSAERSGAGTLIP